MRKITKNETMKVDSYPTEVQSSPRGHSSTHCAEFTTSEYVPIAERGRSTEAVLQLGGQRNHRLVTVLTTPLWVTPGKIQRQYMCSYLVYCLKYYNKKTNCITPSNENGPNNMIHNIRAI